MTLQHLQHMAGKDYYKLLGVDRGADDETLKKAYKKLALKVRLCTAELTLRVID